MWYSRLGALQLGQPSLPVAAAASRRVSGARGRGLCLAAATSAAPGAAEWLARNTGLVFSGGLALGAGASAAWSQLQERCERDDGNLGGIPSGRREGAASSSTAPKGSSMSIATSGVGSGGIASIPWVRELSQQEGVREVLSAGQMLRRHPLGQYVLRQDHLFDTLISSEQIKEMRCFYDPKNMRFHCVVELGVHVCGYPSTVHGGLTATIIDETFGGLSLSMWQGGKMGVQAPGYTARLELDYKAKMPASSVIICTSEVEKKEDRKLWMRATVSDGSGLVYSEARALFVSPRLRNVLFGWVPQFGRRSSGKAGREERGR